MSHRLLRSLLAFLLAGLTNGLFAATTDFSTGWRFHLGDAPGAEAPGFPDAAWARVSAPHTARLEARVTDKESHQQWEGLCWYRKTFSLPSSAAGQVVLLRFEGAMNVAEVFVDGRKLATSLDGYTPFVVDLTEVAKRIQPITIALRLDNRATEVTGPKPLPVLDFHLYHGLYRTVSLIIKPTLHITDEILESKPASGGVFVTYPQVSPAAATVSAQVHVRNRADTAATFTLVTTLRSRDGKQLAHHEESALQLAPGEDRAFTSLLEVRRPRLWSPQSPNLHYLEVSLLSGGQLIDSQRERIGIRRFELGQGGLLLNGEKLFLRGVNRHQEYPYVGNAVPARAQYRDALKIKQAGFDCIRLSHYPQSPDFLAACDELGLVTIDGILGWQYNPGTPAFVANRLTAARALVRRDRNHPCALLWELCLNETSMTPAFVAALHAAGHDEYPGDQMATSGWLQGYDVKLTARQHGSTKQFHGATFPGFVSEYGDWEYYAGNAGLNQEAWGNLKQAERTSRQSRGDGEVRLLQQATNLQEAHNENRGTQAFGDGYWVMYDYNRGYASDLETSGIMDLFRLPKFSHAFFQSQRDPQEVLSDLVGAPMVFAATYWTAQSPLEVRVFSNCEEVELRLNGRSLGRQKPDQDRNSTYLPHPPFTFKVARFEPGELRAVGFVKGKAVAKHRVNTPGPAKRLELSYDRSGRALAPGGDLVFVYARIVDANGTTVHDATLPVKFQIDGDAQLIGDNPIAAEAGIATILLKTGPEFDSLKFEAETAGLKDSLKIKAE